MEGILCFSHILLLASSAFNKINDIAGLAGGCSSVARTWKGWPVVMLTKNRCAGKGGNVGCHMGCSMVWFTVGKFELGADQKFFGSLVGGRPQWGALEWPVGGDGRR